MRRPLPLTGTTALLLGLEEHFTASTASGRPGHLLLLYTDGLVESTQHHVDSLPEDQIATAPPAADCDQALDMPRTAGMTPAGTTTTTSCFSCWNTTRNRTTAPTGPGPRSLSRSQRPIRVPGLRAEEIALESGHREHRPARARTLIQESPDRQRCRLSVYWLGWRRYRAMPPCRVTVVGDSKKTRAHVTVGPGLLTYDLSLPRSGPDRTARSPGKLAAVESRAT